MFSIIQTALENGLNPFTWLAYLFKTAPNIDINDPEQFKMLLPDHAPDDCKAPKQAEEKSDETNKY
jgi:transposase